MTINATHLSSTFKFKIGSPRRGLNASFEAPESRIALSMFNVNTETSSCSAMATADSNSSASNTINLTASITLTDTAAGELSVAQRHGARQDSDHRGNGNESRSDAAFGFHDAQHRRAADRSGVSGSVTVIVKDLTITNGQVNGASGSILGDSAAQGGGVSITGGKVTLSKVVIQGNNAIGANGNDGAEGADGSGATPPKPGQMEPSAPPRGGGIYMRGGTLTLTNTVVQYNVAQGGRGGNGGAGGKGDSSGQNGAAGGNGGNGGAATGAGIYVAGGELVMISSNAHPPGYTGIYQVAVQLNGAVGGKAEMPAMAATVLPVQSGTCRQQRHGRDAGGHGKPGVHGLTTAEMAEMAATAAMAATLATPTAGASTSQAGRWSSRAA